MPEEQATNRQNKPDRRRQLSGENQSKIQHPDITIDPNYVPPELQFLIPYAKKWGVQDKEIQQELLHAAAQAELEELYKVVQPAFDDIDSFVMLHQLPNELGSNEARVFDALQGAALEANDILAEVMPRKEWLKLIGWPERFPGPKLDPMKFPPELHPIIPYAEKWVIEDDIIRSYVLEESTNKELQEFLADVNQIGLETIRKLALNMTEDEMLKEEGYILLKMLELAERAELLLKMRNHSSAQ